MYSSEHGESVEKLQNWYWKKFEVMFEAFMKRRALEEAREIKNSMISGLWGNPNYDEKQYREKALKDIENNYQEAINIIYNGENSEEYQVTYDQGLFSGIPEDIR